MSAYEGASSSPYRAVFYTGLALAALWAVYIVQHGFTPEEAGGHHTGGNARFHLCECPFGHPCTRMLSPLYPFEACLRCTFGECQKG